MQSNTKENRDKGKGESINLRKYSMNKSDEVACATHPFASSDYGDKKDTGNSSPREESKDGGTQPHRDYLARLDEHKNKQDEK